MPEDLDDRPFGAAPEEIEVSPGNRIGRDIGPAVKFEDMFFQFRQGDRFQTEAPQLPGGMEQIKMDCRSLDCGGACHTVPGFEQRPVKTLAVEGDHHRSLGEPLRQIQQHGCLFAVIAHEELLHNEAVTLPPGHADQERIGAGAAGQAGRLGVEKEPLACVGNLGSGIRAPAGAGPAARACTRRGRESGRSRPDACRRG